MSDMRPILDDGLPFSTYRCVACANRAEGAEPQPIDDPTMAVALSASDGKPRCASCEEAMAKMKVDPSWRPPGQETPDIEPGGRMADGKHFRWKK